MFRQCVFLQLKEPDMLLKMLTVEMPSRSKILVSAAYSVILDNVIYITFAEIQPTVQQVMTLIESMRRAGRYKDGVDIYIQFFIPHLLKQQDNAVASARDAVTEGIATEEYDRDVVATDPKRSGISSQIFANVQPLSAHSKVDAKDLYHGAYRLALQCCAEGKLGREALQLLQEVKARPDASNAAFVSAAEETKQIESGKHVLRGLLFVFGK
jgi:hypothetical protein